MIIQYPYCFVSINTVSWWFDALQPCTNASEVQWKGFMWKGCLETPVQMYVCTIIDLKQFTEPR